MGGRTGAYDGQPIRLPGCINNHGPHATLTKQEREICWL